MLKRYPGLPYGLRPIQILHGQILEGLPCVVMPILFAVRSISDAFLLQLLTEDEHEKIGICGPDDTTSLVMLRRLLPYSNGAIGHISKA